MRRLDGKVAIVTGAGSGIGRSSALLFAAEGAKVICADVSGQEDVTVSRIGDAAIGVRVDVSAPADVQRMTDVALETFGRIDVLFNNAGFTGPIAPLAEMEDHMFDRLVAVNLKAVFLGMKAVIPLMTAAGGGSIINTASAAGLVGWKGLAAYAATKGGVVQMTKSAALDCAELGIRVNAICPGMTWTGQANAPEDSTPPSSVRPPQPMARFGLSIELANAALFLACEDSSFVTGVALPVDGGYTAR